MVPSPASGRAGSYASPVAGPRAGRVRARRRTSAPGPRRRATASAHRACRRLPAFRLHRFRSPGYFRETGARYRPGCCAHAPRSVRSGTPALTWRRKPPTAPRCATGSAGAKSTARAAPVPGPPTQRTRLGFNHTADQFNDLIAGATRKRWSATVLLERSVADELEDKHRRSVESRHKRARLGRFKPLADWDWDWPTALLGVRPIVAPCTRDRLGGSGRSGPPVADPTGPWAHWASVPPWRAVSGVRDAARYFALPAALHRSHSSAGNPDC